MVNAEVERLRTATRIDGACEDIPVEEKSQTLNSVIELAAEHVVTNGTLTKEEAEEIEARFVLASEQRCSARK